ncbi:MAG: carboxypeptidase-like regulatory domain-containing protein [Bacteroidales bacterium]
MKQLKFLLVLLVFTLLSFSLDAQNGTITGTVVNAEDQEPLQGIKVSVKDSRVEEFTDNTGSFKIEVPSESIVLVISGEGFEKQEFPMNIQDGETRNLDEIFLHKTGDRQESVMLPVISLKEFEVTDERDQMISGLLHSSDDIFVSTAAYDFGMARFNIRGYDARYTELYMNGLPMNDMESGWPVWSDWGGLNDVTRNEEVYFGMNSGNFSLPEIGGVNNIDTRPTNQYPGFKGSYASANRNYRHRVMATYSTGLMDNDWAFTISGSHRWAQEGYIDGTFYDAYAYFFAAEKKINENHSVSFTSFGAPNERAKRGGAPQIAYDLEGTNYYNPYWGYQDGEKRSERVDHQHKPVMMLNHYWDVNENMKINSAVGFSFGKRGGTRLTWYDAADPRPTYYRNLPLETEESPETWQNRQLDWDYFYFANRKNLYAVDNPSNKEEDLYVGNLSKYFLEDEVTNHKRFLAKSTIEYALNDLIDITGAFNFKHYRGNRYKVLDDLLGGDFWVDIDKFAERGDPSWDYTKIDEIKQSDLNNYNRIVKEGDKFGYDYDAVINEASMWGKADFVTNRSDYYVGLGLSHTNFYREGHMKNGKFPEDSYGKSDVNKFFNYRLNAGGTNKITGRHILSWNMMYQTEAPYFEQAYVSPRTRDHMVDDLKSERIMGGDFTYTIRTPMVQGRATAYYTQIHDQTDIMSFYHDRYRSFVNYVMDDISKEYKGFEIGLETNLTTELSLKGVAAIGEYKYTSRPNVTVIQDNTSEVNIKDQTVYVKDFFVSGTPQTAFSFGVNYDSQNYWWAELSANYFQDTYLSFNPARRTEAAVAGLDYNSPYGEQKAEEITEQERLEDAFSLNFTGGKSWKIDDYYISLFLSVDNLLNKTDFNTGGYEELRFDYETQDLNNFPPRYYYAYGRNYYLILSFRF